MDLLPLHRWILKEFAGQTPTWSELQRRVLSQWCISRADLVEVMRELLQWGLVQRVAVDGAAIYRFPPSAGNESGALGHTFQRVVFHRPSDETRGEFVHMRVVFRPPTDESGSVLDRTVKRVAFHRPNDVSAALDAASSGTRHLSPLSNELSSLACQLLERFADRSVTVPEMVRVTGLSDDDVRRALQELEARGLVRRRGNWFVFPPAGQPKLME